MSNCSYRSDTVTNSRENPTRISIELAAPGDRELCRSSLSPAPVAEASGKGEVRSGSGENTMARDLRDRFAQARSQSNSASGRRFLISLEQSRPSPCRGDRETQWLPMRGYSTSQARGTRAGLLKNPHPRGNAGRWQRSKGSSVRRFGPAVGKGETTPRSAR